MIEVRNIRLSPDDDKTEILDKACRKLRIDKKNVKKWFILKESLDARNKGNIFFIYTACFDILNENKILKNIKNKDVLKFEEENTERYGNIKCETRPVVVGFGPAGIFAAMTLTEMGFKPIVLERGADVDQRVKDVEKFWNEGILSTESNVQFGEGGAGTFSDGKLTSRGKDKRAGRVFKAFVENGAPPEILYAHNPHIGTDLLRNVVKNMREKIIACGGEVRFFSKATDIAVENGKVMYVEVNNSERIYCRDLILAIGHSARDTFEMLYRNNAVLSQKPFAMGVRIEHSQNSIDKAQFGNFAGTGNLGPAEYKLTSRSSDGRGVYTFCMCPGGYVVAAASEEGMVCVNGMSNYNRGGENANSAVLVQIGPEDFGSGHPLAGMYLQREIEKKAFIAGGGRYNAPAQRLGEFLGNKYEENDSFVRHTYRPGITMCNLNDVLPKFMCSALKEGIAGMAKKLKGFDDVGALVTAVESRSSSPVRIERENETFESLWAKGLYPVGEGAGYAGGIVSSAIDGIKAAEKIYCKYKI